MTASAIPADVTEEQIGEIEGLLAERNRLFDLATTEMADREYHFADYELMSAARKALPALLSAARSALTAQRAEPAREDAGALREALISATIKWFDTAAEDGGSLDTGTPETVAAELVDEALLPAISQSPSASASEGTEAEAWIKTLLKIAQGASASAMLDDGAAHALAVFIRRLTASASEETAEGWRAPEGYALVPIHPTPEMQRAGLKGLDEGGIGPCGCDQHEVWAAMLAAAPNPQKQGAGE